MQVDGIRVFTATIASKRSKLGEEATLWIIEQKKISKDFEIVDKVVTQSSDNEFHCLSITLFYQLGAA